MAGKIIRITMFKVPLKENQIKLTELYKTLRENARKDDKPYILSLSAAPTYDDPRNQGYTFVAKSEFSSLEDMQYYDTGCQAHSELKLGAKPLVEGVMTVYYSDPEGNAISV